MNNDEWEPVNAADTMEERIEEFANLARSRSEQKDKPIEDVVHDLTHDSYLLKHTTDDVLNELQDLEATYPDAFYNGEANDHILTYLDDDQDFEFWYDFAYLSLAAGIEWAVLDALEATVQGANSE